MDSHELIDVALRLGVATLCGAGIGFNRERKHRPAGLRTIMLVALGAAAFALLGDRLTHDIDDKTAMGRIAAGIVGGIGFLGAGTILQSGPSVRGVTTAASIWAAAGIGCACGLGYYWIGVVSVALAMAVLWLAPIEKEVFGDTQDDRGREIKGEKDQAMRQSRHQVP